MKERVYPYNMLQYLDAGQVILNAPSRRARAIANTILQEVDLVVDGGKINLKDVLILKFKEGKKVTAIAHKIGVAESTIYGALKMVKIGATQPGFLMDLLQGRKEPGDALVNSRTIDQLMFGVSAAKALQASGIMTLGELREFTQAGMLDEIPNIGYNRGGAIVKKLNDYYGIYAAAPQDVASTPQDPAQSDRKFPFGKPTVVIIEEERNQEGPKQEEPKNPTPQEIITNPTPVATRGEPDAGKSSQSESMETEVIRPGWVHAPKQPIVDRRYLLVGGRHRLDGTYEKDRSGEIRATEYKTVDDASIFNGYVPIESPDLNIRQAYSRLQFELERHPGMTHVTVFITGNPEAQIAMINACRRLQLGLTFMLYHRDINCYYPMDVDD